MNIRTCIYIHTYIYVYRCIYAYVYTGSFTIAKRKKLPLRYPVL